MNPARTTRRRTRPGARFVVVLLFVVACKREPAGETIDKASVAEVNVDVRADGGLALDGRAVNDGAELESRTREIAQQKPMLHAVIHVEEGVPYDRVIDAEHALKRGGAAHMTFVVDGKEAGAK